MSNIAGLRDDSEIDFSGRAGSLRDLVVVYERVSTGSQDISRQAVQRERAAADHPGREIRVIADDGVSAFKVPIFERRGGAELCSLIESGRVHSVYADAQDRLSRGDDLEWVTFRTLCETTGTQIFIDGRELRDDFGGRLEGYLKAALARQESVEKSHRVKSGKRASAAEGRRNGGPRPFGYEVVAVGFDERKRRPLTELRHVPHEVAALRRMRAEVLAGRSLREIAKALNETGVRTVNGAAWSQTRIGQMIRNRLYVGKVKNRDAEYDGNHLAVFTDSEWAELQAALTSRRRGTARAARVPMTHLFAGGMMRCGCCGASIIPRSTKNEQGRRYETYRCAGRVYGSSPSCTQPTVRREVIDPAVLDYFERAAHDFDDTRRHFADQGERLLTETRAMLDHAQRDVALADDRLARVKRDYRDGKIDADEWREHRDELTADRDAASAEARRLVARVSEVEASAALFDAEGEALRFLTELRAAVAGTVADAETVAAARQALMSRFDGFTLHAVTAPPLESRLPLPDGWIRSRTYTAPELLLVGGYVVEPHPKPDAILDADKAVEFPLLRGIGVTEPNPAGVSREASRR